MRLLVILILAALCCWRTLSLNLTCSGPLCYITLDYPDHFAIDDDVMLVGLRNEIIQLTLDFTPLQRVETFNDRLRLSCRRNKRNEVTDCHNYHRSIIFPRGDQVIVGKVTANETFIVCGTNYYNPTCEYRLKSDLLLARRHISAGFCPEQPKVQMSFVESDTTLWVGTVLKRFQNGFLSQSRHPFNGIVSMATIIDSGYWLKISSFVDMYEKGEYIYAFFKEVPVEIKPNAIRSRVARICKRDAGHYIGYQRTYQSFIKSTIRCAVKGLESDDERYQKIPFYFDDLHDTTLLESGSYRQSSAVRPMQLYGVFQNTRNGPAGSVVCVYTLDHMKNDVSRVFRGAYLRREARSGTWRRVANRKPFTCKTGRSVQAMQNDLIMYNDVSQVNPPSYPLYMKDGQRFHKIVVGQVTGLDGIVYEVMFIAAEDEEGNYFITKVSYVEGRTEQRSVEHDVLMLDQSDHRINHMHYHKQDNGEDILYISTPNRLYRMNPLYCGGHQSCSSCVASMDPYCVYDTIQEACVGINSANQNTALQNVTGGTANCPPGTDGNTDGYTTSPTAKSPTASQLKTADDDDDEKEEAWKWAGIGTTIGMCMGFGTGISFMFVWQRTMKLCRENLVKSKPDDVVSSKGAAHGSGDHKRAANYTAIKNELPMSSEYREQLNSSVVNESFELTGINRTGSFHSLSCLVTKDD